MAKKNKTYWPHMIMGFFLIGISLGYWTVKSAANMPVQESNDYMMKYQLADIHINDILDKKIAFDNEYVIRLHGKETMVMTDNIHSNRPQPNPVKLSQGANSFTYTVEKHNGSVVLDANVSFLLTQPHSRTEDQMVGYVPYASGEYHVEALNITKPGRYTLKLRAIIDENTIGYSEIPAYLEP